MSTPPVVPNKAAEEINPFFHRDFQHDRITLFIMRYWCHIFVLLTLAMLGCIFFPELSDRVLYVGPICKQNPITREIFCKAKNVVNSF